MAIVRVGDTIQVKVERMELNEGKIYVTVRHEHSENTALLIFPSNRIISFKRNGPALLGPNGEKLI